MPTITWILLGIVGAAALAAMIGLVVVVDDWSRDLTSNFASTSDDARDPRLRPIRNSQSVTDMEDLILDITLQLDHWETTKFEKDADLTTIHFERCTSLFRFRDDVIVRIRKTDDGSEITADSRSRIGRADLGQNPRNLIELLEAIRQQLR